MKPDPVTLAMRPSKRSGLGLLALGLLAMAAVGTGGWFQIGNDRVRARRTAEETLNAVADLKAGEIAKWMKERRGDAETILNNPQARQFLNDPGNAAVREELLQWMGTVQRVYDYSAMFLLDGGGQVRLAAPAGASELDGDCAGQIQAALRGREVVVTGLHRNQPDQPIHLSLLVPIGAGPQMGQPAEGLFVLIIEPARFLYPLVQSWPTPSVTAETLLVRREGNEVLFLSDLRHRTNTALVLRRSADEPDLPAAMLVRGEVGTTPCTSGWKRPKP